MVPASAVVAQAALLTAAENGKVHKVRELLDKGVSANATLTADQTPPVDGDTTFTPLFQAACFGHVEVFKMLLAAKASHETRCSDSIMSPLEKASEEGQIECVRALFEARAEVNTACNNGQSPLFYASMLGRVEVSQLLLDATAEVDSHTESAPTPLWIGAQNGHTEVCQLLLRHGAAVNWQDDEGITPLRRAAEKDHAGCVQALLESSADASLASYAHPSATPLVMCSQNGHMRSLACLLWENSDECVTFTSPKASRAGLEFNLSVEGRPRSASAAINAIQEDTYGATPLFAAVRGGWDGCTLLLLHAKADVGTTYPDIVNGFASVWKTRGLGPTVLDIALLARQLGVPKLSDDTIQRLRDAGASSNAEDARKAAADALLNEITSEQETSATLRAKSKGKRKKGRGVHFSLGNAADSPSPSSTDCGSTSDAQHRPSKPVAMAIVDMSAGMGDGESIAVHDIALRRAVAAGDLEGLSAALEKHRMCASEVVVAEARAAREKLKERRKKQSQKQRRAHAGAMGALARLHDLSPSTEIEAVREGLALAMAHHGEVPALDEAISASRQQLEGLTLSQAAAAPPHAARAAEAVRVRTGAAAVELHLSEVVMATDGFAAERKIGSGGFGQVFLGDPIRALATQSRVAVKRATPELLEPSDLQREVTILTMCQHPHLLPLLGYCLEATTACLIFPLMVGGSLQTRLDLQSKDLEYLRRIGWFTSSSPPRPLTWRQKVRIVQQAVEALVYMHSSGERKRRTWHRDFKPANILLDQHLNAFLGDTGFAKACVLPLGSNLPPHAKAAHHTPCASTASLSSPTSPPARAPTHRRATA